LCKELTQHQPLLLSSAYLQAAIYLNKLLPGFAFIIYDASHQLLVAWWPAGNKISFQLHPEFHLNGYK